MQPISPSHDFLHVLHVEDNVPDVELIKSLLEQEFGACRSEQVETQEQFLAALDSAESRFDVILSDFSMPKFDGLSALDLARQHRPDIPFIFVSGTIGEENAVKALKNGAADYVLKDRMARLASAVRRALDEKCEQKGLENPSSQVQHFENIGLLAGSIARDLNSLLTPMLMSIDLLQQKITDEEARRWIKILDTSAQQGADLARQLSTLAFNMPEDRLRAGR